MSKSGNTSSKEKYFRRIYSFFRDHPGILITITYIYISGVGLMYEYFYYSEFGINIFNYAEANDFILAAFREPFTISFAVVTIIIFIVPIIYHYFGFKRIKHTPIFFRRRFYIVLSIIATLTYSFLPAYYIGSRNATEIKNENSDVEKLIMRNSRKYSDKNMSMIGTTGKFVFFYSLDSEDTLIIPISSISRINYGDSVKVKNDTSKSSME